ncbi:MAG: glycosyltransferase family 4 protein [Nitrospirales bacterium]
MKILIIHNFYREPGGEDQVVADETKLLQTHGHQVFHYFSDNKTINESQPLSLAIRTIWNRQAYRDIRKVISIYQPDVAHFHNTFPLISPAGYHAAKAEGIPVVQTLHNYRFFCPNAHLFRNGQNCESCLTKKFPWPGIAHACYRGNRMTTTLVGIMLGFHQTIKTLNNKIDLFIALTQAAKDKFIAGGLPAHKIMVKPNFVSPDPLKGCGTGHFGLFVGRLIAEKGVLTLLNAWKKLLSPLPLVIVGQGLLSPLVKKAASENPLITWLGRKSSMEVMDLLGQSSCAIFPSEWQEPFGRVVVEAFSKGTPVITSNFGAMAELVDHERTGLHFKAGDSSDLANRVDHLMGNDHLRQQMGLEARKEYERKFTAESNYEALSTIYRKAMSQEMRELKTASSER